MAGKTSKLVWGVGVNDADYVQQICETVDYVEGRRKRRMIWRCPFYAVWARMLERCYSLKRQEGSPTYRGCSVAEEWLTFSNFKAWMETQDWEGKQLDKDLLIPHNKVYGPDTCVFVDGKVNKFVLECNSARGEWPIGVIWHKDRHKFQAQCSNPFTGKRGYIGSYDCPNEAYAAWLKRKRELAKQLAAIQTDPRVAQALIDRYDVDVYVPLHENSPA